VLNQPQTPIPTSGWTPTRVPCAPVTNGTVSIWYQLSVTIPSTWNQPGRHFFVTLGQAGHYQAVYWNGNPVYSPATGYNDQFGQFAPFTAEVTPQIVFGSTNTLQIYTHEADSTYIRRGVNINQSSCPADNPNCIGNAYRSAADTDQERNWVGITGDVTLFWTPQSYIASTEIITSVRDSSITANLTVSGAGSFTARASVFDGTTDVLDLPAQTVNSGSATLEAAWSNPTLWGQPPYGTPKLYTLQTSLLQSGSVVDVSYTRFGFRETWVSGTTVYLNGVKLWLLGSFTAKLASIRTTNDRRPDAFMDYILEQSGFNLFQSHWDDAGDAWLNIADEMGIFVVGSYFCNGAISSQSMLDDATDWTDWQVATATEWAQARLNHPSIIIWRPMDVPVKGINKSALYPALAAGLRSVDTTRPIADGSDIDTFLLNINIGGSNCGTDSGFVTRIQAETKPLLVKEVGGDFSLSCAPAFLSQLYSDARNYGALGVILQGPDLFTQPNFNPSWFSISGIGNRPSSVSSVPDWLTGQWTPTAYSGQFAGLWEQYFQPSLFSSSPLSGDYQATGIPVGTTLAFLSPASGMGSPTGALVASDGSGTVWFVTLETGSYYLIYLGSNGSTVELPVTVTAPASF